ncbi:MAG: peptidoglycan-binding protein, partial [Clostridia bacterium]|nr:peptidoglycan-binding protein [Clostridia bacterium]
MLALARYAARGIYYGVRAVYNFCMALPPKILLVASSAFGFLVMAVIIVAIASPGNRSSADAAETLAAFSNDSQLVEDGAAGFIDSGNVDPYAAYDPEAEAAQLSAAGDGAEDGAPAASESDAAAAETAVAFTEVKKGDDDPIVAVIQARLMELGYMDADEPTEHFGSLTASALSIFQRHNELDDDGICGEATYNLLMSDDAKIYVMQRGDSGDDVSGVQQRLYELGYLDNKANITGNFGEKTEEAAIAFQKKNELTADGKVGVKTISLLYSEDVVSNAYTIGDENPVILSCQQALKKLGYITFTPDGVMGRATVSAIKSFQEVNGLTKDGALGPETRDLLLSDEAQAKVIQLGDYGTDVKNIQERLIKLNYLTRGSATSYFGEITQKAVKAFQKRNSLGADGKVGAVTLTLLNSSSAKKASSPVNEDDEEKSSGSS